MKKIFNWIRETLTWIKILVNRSLGYLSIANSLMIGVLFLSSLQDKGFEINIVKFIPIIILVTFVGLLVVGWIDDKLGLHAEEQRLIATRNPYVIDIIERLNRLEGKIDDIKKK